VTFVAAGGAGTGAGFGATGAGAALGATGAGGEATTATGAGATMAPSQPTAAVAGVQLASRQQRPVEFFQASPEALRQLSTDWAPATVASAAAFPP